MRHVTRLGLFACVATAALLVGCKAGGRTEGTASATKTCSDKSACTEGKTCSGTSAEAKKTCADKAAGCSEAKSEGKTCPATGKPMN